ncbi:Sodium/myo-inositol cotransporter 2 [Mizuhopecten yessoensis]|uniref:Sodium/myo-inositol cotransporter 2 n=2 Tax=Mizuhopecten yessoensis TaxID=6573 RepID=A0A210Q1M1_MIZYE|nr:Sodium/myo-inositol cotransporter 2 [Mizuhopecten yessoensis]
MAEDKVSGTLLHYGDFIVIIVYFILVLFVGLWTSRKNRGSAGGYFLAGRNMHFVLVGASLFASNIGSIHFVGLAGSGAASGIAIGLYELNALYIMLLLGYIFLPVYIASGVYTMPEYLKCRFGGQRIQVSLAVLALLVYIFTKISADLYAGAIFIEQSLHWDMYWSILLLLSVAAIFTITGGLTAVVWTDFIQTIIMIIGATALMILSFVEVGGFNGMVEKYPYAVASNTTTSNSTCGLPRDDFMHLFRSPSTGDLPWPGIIGLSINSIWYWCSDQVIVQRALAAKSIDHAKAGTIVCGFLKVLPLFLFVFPGMIARILFPDTVACSDPETCMEVCGSSTGCSNIAYPSLVINLMPPGARGMMLAVMLAGLMSSLTSIFNSSSTIIAMDIWTKIRKSASELEIMIVGRVSVLLLVVISIIWIPVIRASEGSELFVYIQEVSSFTQPPICCIFLLGIFWTRLNEKGAFFGMVTGMTMGMVRFIVQYSYTTPKCGDPGPDPRPSVIKDFHYLYFSCFLFLLTGFTAIVISLLTKPLPAHCLYRLTFWTRHSKEKRLDITTWEKLERRKDKHSNGTDKCEHELLEVEESRQLQNDVNNGNVESHNPDDKSHKIDENIPEDKSDNSNNDGTNCPSWACHVVNWVCGIDRNRESLSSHQIQRKDMLSVEENRRWKITSNVLSVLLMGIALVFFIYFA